MRAHHDSRTSFRRTISRLPALYKTVGLIIASVVVVSAIVLVQRTTFSFLTEVPASGGSVTEGAIGTARFINPALALSPVDKDMVALVYAGLLSPSEHGLIPELASEYAVSEDGLQYTFFLREDATFHDGTPVTADDVAFTIGLVQQEQLKSPQFVHWEGVAVETVGTHEVRITLPEPYAPFIENMTLGIMPRHIWDGIGIDEIPFSDYNINPIGSGPFKISRVRRDQGGFPQSYELQRFDRYVLGRPFLTDLIIRLFRTEEDALTAYRTGEIDSLGSLSPSLITQATSQKSGDEALMTAPLPRTLAVYYNQNHAPLFTRAEVRETVELLTDRDAVILEALAGYGQPLYGPIPQFNSSTTPEEEPELSLSERTAEAEELLVGRGWKRSEEDGVWELETKDTSYRFSFELTTANDAELVATAHALAEQWRAFGIEVTISTFDSSELTQSIIRPRHFDALLFGSVMGRELDLYAFWHSSQRTDPGLNVAQYTSISADTLLERARTSPDKEVRAQATEEFAEELAKEHPALFLYQPDYLYLAPRHVHNISLRNITEEYERFDAVHTWYSETRRIWDRDSK